MIQTKKTPVLSARTIATFGPHSREEWEVLRPSRAQIYQNTEKLWTLYRNGDPMCVIGLIRRTLMGTGGEVFFLLCREFQLHLRELRRFITRAMRRIVRVLGALTVRVAVDFWIGNRFAQFFGFRYVARIQEPDTTAYNLYELRAAWL